jgi:hypothetical protein
MEDIPYSTQILEVVFSLKTWRSLCFMMNSVFNFFKQHKPQVELEEVLSVRERALRVFSRIEGLK